MKLEHKKEIKLQKGITLIALVITIIVLLILAGVSIATLTGDNGILTKAQKAKEETEKASEEEQEQLADLENIMEGKEIVIRKVVDEKPGELEESKTEQNTFIINSIEDLVAFAHNVTNGNETYANKTVKLGLSLDFASTKSYVDANRTDYGKYGYNGNLKKLLNESGFIPIGTQKRLVAGENPKKSFNGTFDGDGNTIYNLKIREENISDSNEFIGTGMFIANYGTIRDLGIENANIYVDIDFDAWKCVGILAQSNQTGGTIERCHVSGKIIGSINSGDIGGIVGATSGGEIYDCYSEVDMEILGVSSEGMIYEGLIVGSCNNGGMIKNIYSKGSMHPQMKGVVGGVVGCCDTGEVKNAYTVSKIKAEYTDETGYLRLGAFCQYDPNKIISDCYYLENNIKIIGDGTAAAKIGESKTEADMKGEEFVTLLNKEQDGSHWKQDTNNINDGYPILSWQQ